MILPVRCNEQNGCYTNDKFNVICQTNLFRKCHLLCTHSAFFFLFVCLFFYTNVMSVLYMVCSHVSV